MIPRIRFAIFMLASLMLATLTASLTADEPVDFNRDIRPILAKHCFKCHGRDSDHREAGLRLDLRELAISKLESELIAIVPEDPRSSELINRVTSDDPDLLMPPGDGAGLNDRQISLLRNWISEGAPYAEHWSFTGPTRPANPSVKLKSWPANGIDPFVLHRLERTGLQPSEEADRHTLIRRLSFDIRGLPPTPEEVERFVSDSGPRAYEDLVDRLLKDTTYGEHWARMWLDLARYADSRGYGSDPLRSNMWRYRDWVIDAFNRNLPYDQFTVEQIAGDLLPEATLEQRIATAFHRNTMTNTEGGTDDEEFRVAAVRDRVDTTIQVWMGLTMGCAKCHSHKYDPITNREYYQFYDIFNQTADNDRPDEAPVINAPTQQQTQQREKITADVAKLQAEIKSLQAALKEEQKTAAKTQPKARFVRVELPGAGKFLSLAEVQVFSGGENLALKGTATQSSTDFGGPAKLAIDGNTDGHYFNAKSTTHSKAENNPWWEVDLGEAKPVDMVVIWSRTDGGLHTRLAGVRLTLLDDAKKSLWQQDAAAAPNPSSQFQPVAVGPVAKKLQSLNAEVAKLEKAKPKIATVPVMQELAQDKRRKTHIMVKGSFLNKGEAVAAGFPAAFHPLPADAPRNRLGVATWLMDKQNPLTARVAVNRYWARLFGAGLVETEEDFGTQGEPPSHPQLLDWLAVEYMENGWNTKALLKTIFLSSTYRQSSRVTEELLEKDPRNRLYSRGPRFRLEAESIRDQALSLAGLLSPKMRGPSVFPPQPGGLWQAAFNGQRNWATSAGEDRYRRGLYTFWRRTVPYPSMASFDAPSREICTVRRIRTNTPIQAFVTLNDPVYVEAAQGLARRIVKQAGPDVDARVAYGLRICLGRPPTAKQIEHLSKLYNSELAYFQSNAEAAVQMATEPLGPLPKELDAADMAAWTVVANVLLNLDGVLTKG